MNDTDQTIETENVADYINQFFTDIGPNLAKNCQMDWFYSGNESVGSLTDIETTKKEIIDICKNININKASCVDNISSEVLRDAFLAVPEKLCLFFNTCFNTASIPNCWKYAKVTPLPKGGNSQSVTNYRPISLLPPERPPMRKHRSSVAPQQHSKTSFKHSPGRLWPYPYKVLDLRIH